MQHGHRSNRKNPFCAYAKESLRSARARDVAANLALAAILSFTNACGIYTSETRTLDFGFGDIALLFFFQLPLFAAALVAFSLTVRYLALKRGRSRFDVLTPRFAPKSIALFAAIMIVCWLPCIIACFPGSINWDTYYQLYQCYPENHPILAVPWVAEGHYTDAYFCDHHPVFTTLVYGGFALASDALFGNWNPGIFVFCSLQCIAMACSLTGACAYLKSRRAPSVLVFCAYGAACLLPPAAMASFTMVKDSFYTWLFVLLFVAVAEIVLTKGQCLSRRRNLVLLIALLLLLCLTKSTGVYLACATMIVCAFYYRAYWRKWAIALAVPSIVMFVVMPYLVFPVLDVAPGGKQEFLGPLFQQTARYVSEHADEITEEEREAIDKVLRYDDLAERYTPFHMDRVKYGWRYGEATEKDLENYYLVWLKEGLKHPKTYLEATWGTCHEFFSSTVYFTETPMQGHMVDQDLDKSWFPNELDGYRASYVGLFKQWAKIPVLNLPICIALYTWWIPLMCLYALRGCIKRYAPVFIPTAFAIFCCLITPAINFRYSYPLALTALLLVAFTGLAIRRSTEGAKSPVPHMKDGRRGPAKSK